MLIKTSSSSTFAILEQLHNIITYLKIKSMFSVTNLYNLVSYTFWR